MPGKVDKLLGIYRTADVADDNQTIPTAQSDGYMSVVDNGGTTAYIYFFANGHRFKVAGTLDDPVAGGAGSPMGLLLAITYSS